MSESQPVQSGTAALLWTEAGAGWIASCGEQQQGHAIIRDARDGGYVWTVDMLPDDSEPAISGLAFSVACAKADAERQVAQWPGLIEGARRHD